jgi:HlyD family secretion protein
MVLSPKADMQLVLQIDEKNLNLLRLNQAAWASADAYPDQKFDAELVYINPRVDPLRGSVEVKLAVPKPSKCHCNGSKALTNGKVGPRCWAKYRR